MNAISKFEETSVIESVLIGGDLSKLTPEQRVSYYKATCDSLGLNSLTRPFEYITLNGRLTLYARKDAADQLRKKHAISIGKPDITFQEDWIIVSVLATTGDGRTDSDLGVVNKKDMQGNFGNVLMKAVTKAKRRVTLSICGLGMLDETEVETIQDARPVVVTETGEIVDASIPAPARPTTDAWVKWDALTLQADDYSLDIPQVNRETVTLDELRLAYKTLAKRIDLYEKVNGASNGDQELRT